MYWGIGVGWSLHEWSTLGSRVHCILGGKLLLHPSSNTKVSVIMDSKITPFIKVCWPNQGALPSHALHGCGSILESRLSVWPPASVWRNNILLSRDNYRSIVDDLVNFLQLWYSCRIKFSGIGIPWKLPDGQSYLQWWNSSSLLQKSSKWSKWHQKTAHISTGRGDVCSKSSR